MNGAKYGYPRFCVLLMVGLFGWWGMGCVQTIGLPGLDGEQGEGDKPDAAAIVDAKPPAHREGFPCGQDHCEKGKTCFVYHREGEQSRSYLCAAKLPEEIEYRQVLMSIYCDGPEDCPTGQQCYQMVAATPYNNVQFRCDTGKSGWELVCRQDSDCPNDRKCGTAWQGQRVCKRR